MVNVLSLITPFLAVAAPQLGALGAPDLVVDLGYTKYRGAALSIGITQWLGMRYASPPLGELRFRAPQNPVTEEDVLDAFTVRTCRSCLIHEKWMQISDTIMVQPL